MREAIEELFRMYNVEPTEALLEALVLYVKHEQLNARHDLAIKMMHHVDRITGKSELETES